MKRTKKQTLVQLTINLLASVSLTYLFVLTGVFTPFWHIVFFVGSFITFTGMEIAKEEHKKECKREWELKELQRKQKEQALHQARLEASQKVIYISKGQHAASTQDLKTPPIKRDKG